MIRPKKANELTGDPWGTIFVQKMISMNNAYR